MVLDCPQVLACMVDSKYPSLAPVPNKDYVAVLAWRDDCAVLGVSYHSCYCELQIHNKFEAKAHMPCHILCHGHAACS